MSTKWTPGPWNTGGIFNPGTPKETQNIWGPTEPGNASGVLVAQYARIPDARLIAAAPELYAALEALQDELRGTIGIEGDAIRVGRLVGRFKQASAALAKARGEETADGVSE